MAELPLRSFWACSLAEVLPAPRLPGLRLPPAAPQAQARVLRPPDLGDHHRNAVVHAGGAQEQGRRRAVRLPAAIEVRLQAVARLVARGPPSLLVDLPPRVLERVLQGVGPIEAEAKPGDEQARDVEHQRAVDDRGEEVGGEERPSRLFSRFGAPGRGLHPSDASPGLPARFSGTLRSSSVNTAEPRAPPDTPLRANTWLANSGQAS